MSHGILGRTNRAFPPVWLALQTPPPDGAAAMAEAVAELNVPLDVTAAPGLWSGFLRGRDDLFLTAAGNSDWERATEEVHATDLVQANLIGTLSALGRETIDVFWLRVRRGVEEYQIWGALQALESARQDGHIRFLGLLADGPGIAVLGVWQFHDAFDIIQIPRTHRDDDAYTTLAPLADERRVGVITSRPLEWGHGLRLDELPAAWRLRNLAKSSTGLSLAESVVADLAQERTVLVGVRTAEEARAMARVYDKGSPVGLRPYLDEVGRVWDDPASWTGLENSDDRMVRDAARRRGRPR